MESAAPATVRIEAAGDVLRVVQITDTHIMADPAGRFEGMDTAASLHAVLEAVASLPRPPHCLLATGDLVNQPATAAYERFREIILGSPVPVYCLPGNHDDPAMMRRLLGHSPPAATPGRVEAGAWRLVLLDDFKGGTDAGRLPQRELERLREALAAPGARHVLVAVHHHPVSIGSPWMDAMILENAAELLEALDGSERVRGLIFGHIHQAFEARHRGIPLLGAPSTCVQFLPGSLAYGVERQPPGFRELLLHADGRLETRVLRVPAAAGDW